MVNKATSTVTLASLPNPSTFGASVTFTATVTAGATGTVTFEDNGTAISGAVPISGTTATFTTSTLSVGTHPITASYGGDTNYNSAASTAVSQVVNKAASTVTLASSPNPSTFGASVTFTATVTAGATGTVTFEDGATSLGTGTIASGVATLTVSTLAVGTHPITASYGGDTSYNPAVSTAVSQVVNKAAATVTLISAPNPSTFGAVVTLTATVTSGATGTVTFEDGATSIGTGTIASGVATLTVSALTVGTHARHGELWWGQQLQPRRIHRRIPGSEQGGRDRYPDLCTQPLDLRGGCDPYSHGHNRRHRNSHLRRRRNIYWHGHHRQRRCYPDGLVHRFPWAPTPITAQLWRGHQLQPCRLHRGLPGGEQGRPATVALASLHPTPRPSRRLARPLPPRSRPERPSTVTFEDGAASAWHGHHRQRRGHP